jgi:hypothetical protein
MLSTIVEDRQFRSVRAWPVWSGKRDKYLVTELGHEVRVDGVNFDTAPIKNGAEVSMLGISMDDRTVEAGLHNPTDHLSHKALLENFYLKVGDQYIAFEMNRAFVRDPKSSYRVLSASGIHAFTIGKHRDVNGCIVSAFDAYTAAGITIDIHLNIFATMNLELADTNVRAEIAYSCAHLPDHPSLKDSDTIIAISQDISKIVKKQVSVVGFTIDVDRLNLLNAEKYKPQPTATEIQNAAAESLAARYTNAS